MHKICYGIIAFEKPEHIKRKIEALYTKEDFFIVHWNKNSSKEDFLELKSMFLNYSNVYIHSKYRVYWGHASILYANLSNMKKALQLNLDFEHFICLSQQTYPIKSINYIKNYLSQYKNQSFISSVIIKKNDITHPIRGHTSDIKRVSKKYYYIYQKHGFSDISPLERIKECYMLLTDFIYYFPKILPKTIVILKTIKKTYPPRQTVQNKDIIINIYHIILYILLLPYRFIKHSLYNDWRDGFSNYMTDLLYPVYKNDKYLITTNSGPDICLAKKHIEYILTDKKAKRFSRNLSVSFAPEEFFIETVLFYSKFYNNECRTDLNCMSARITNIPYKLINQNQFSQLKPQHPDCKYKFEDTLFTRKISDTKVMDLLDQYISKN